MWAGLAPDCDYIEVVGSSDDKTFNTHVFLRSQPCVVIGALPERLVSIHTFGTIVFAERGYPFPLSIYPLKPFSFPAPADNLNHQEDRAWQTLKRHLPLLISRCGWSLMSIFLNWASHLQWLVQTDVFLIIVTDVLTCQNLPSLPEWRTHALCCSWTAMSAWQYWSV